MSTQVPTSRVVGGRYRLVAPLGRGGMGTVWSAVDETLGRQVAVKEITPPPELDDVQRGQLRERTLREARAAARIDSPAAVTVYDVVEEDGRPWIVMQLFRARTLADVIREDGPLPDRDVARIGLRVLDALAAAHRSGVLHRDVKPANVLVPDAGQAVLSDFGIASLEGDASMTATGMLIGSPAFMAPERARGVPPSPASDLWSLGATMSTALLGRSPFERDGQIPTLMAVLHDDPEKPPHPGPLAQAINGLLRKDPKDRLGDAAVHELLTRAANTSPADVPADVPAARGRRLGAHPQSVPVLPDTPVVSHEAPPSSIRPGRAAEAPATTYGGGWGRRIVAVLAVALLSAGAVTAILTWPHKSVPAGKGLPRATASASASVPASATGSATVRSSPRASAATGSGATGTSAGAQPPASGRQ
ncbi:MAG: serine/threonine protein kinase, partial [Frankiales bacterium]|nr:serine/threonine protein kinase [Frankiales bacterium]